MHPPSDNLLPGLSVVVPCFNEELAVAATVESVDLALSRIETELGLATEMIFVNDGSVDRTAEILSTLQSRFSRLKVVANRANRGYGASLKRGISEVRYDRIAITDADGTYPNDRLFDLVEALGRNDMAVGARTGSSVAIPLVRRPAKWALLQYARRMSGADIRDINSGLRALWTRHVAEFWHMLPNGFSLTTTITLALHESDMEVLYVPIDYRHRIGSSSIRPLRDTIGFFSLVLRIAMYFRPLPVLGSLAMILLTAAVVVGAAGKIVLGEVPDVMTVSLVSTGLIFLGLGLLGDLINARRPR